MERVAIQRKKDGTFKVGGKIFSSIEEAKRAAGWQPGDHEHTASPEVAKALKARGGRLVGDELGDQQVAGFAHPSAPPDRRSPVTRLIEGPMPMPDYVPDERRAPIRHPKESGPSIFILVAGILAVIAGLILLLGLAPRGL